jgi:hypothetical protein
VVPPQQGRFLLTISNTAHLQENQEVKTAVGIEHARKGYTELATCGPECYLTHLQATVFNLVYFMKRSAHTVEDSLLPILNIRFSLNMSSQFQNHTKQQEKL